MDFVDRLVFALVVPVDAAEMLPVVLHGTVQVATATKIEAHPAIYFQRLGYFNVPSCNFKISTKKPFGLT